MTKPRVEKSKSSHFHEANDKRWKSRVFLFFSNPMMNAELEEYRNEWDVPENGFDREEPESYAEFETWREEIEDEKKEAWQGPESCTNEIASFLSNHCQIKNNDFHTNLYSIYEGYNAKLPINAYLLFEHYYLFGEVRFEILNDLVGFLNDAFPTYGKSDNTTTIETGLLGSTYGNPSIQITKTDDKPIEISIKIKPETLLANVADIWNVVEEFQKQMEGYVPRLRHRKNIKRDIELYRLTRVERMSPSKAVKEWNEFLCDKPTSIKAGSVQRIGNRLDRIFKSEGFEIGE